MSGVHTVRKSNGLQVRVAVDFGRQAVAEVEFPHIYEVQSQTKVLVRTLPCFEDASHSADNS